MAKSAHAFRTISEVSTALDTPAHVLRFWESKFPQIRPVKRAGGRRYYRPEDLALLGGIKVLLHDEGMTIKGVQKMLREKGVRHVADRADFTEDELAETLGAVAAQAAPANIDESIGLRIPQDADEVTDDWLAEPVRRAPRQPAWAAGFAEASESEDAELLEDAAPVADAARPTLQDGPGTSGIEAQPLATGASTGHSDAEHDAGSTPAPTAETSPEEQPVPNAADPATPPDPAPVAEAAPDMPDAADVTEAAASEEAPAADAKASDAPDTEVAAPEPDTGVTAESSDDAPVSMGLFGWLARAERRGLQPGAMQQLPQLVARLSTLRDRLTPGPDA